MDISPLSISKIVDYISSDIYLLVSDFNRGMHCPPKFCHVQTSDLEEAYTSFAERNLLFNRGYAIKNLADDIINLLNYCVQPPELSDFETESNGNDSFYKYLSQYYLKGSYIGDSATRLLVIAFLQLLVDKHYDSIFSKIDPYDTILVEDKSGRERWKPRTSWIIVDKIKYYMTDYAEHQVDLLKYFGFEKFKKIHKIYCSSKNYCENIYPSKACQFTNKYERYD